MPISRNQLVVLEFLSASRDPRSAPEIADAIAEIGRSSVYEALASLQRADLIEARWDTSGSHARRLIKIKDRGTELLSEEEALRERVRSAAQRTTRPSPQFAG